MTPCMVPRVPCASGIATFPLCESAVRRQAKDPRSNGGSMVEWVGLDTDDSSVLT